MIRTLEELLKKESRLALRKKKKVKSSTIHVLVIMGEPIKGSLVLRVTTLLAQSCRLYCILLEKNSR